MLSDVCLWSVVALFLVLAVVDAGYLYRGRHRGLYVEHREWRPQPEYFTWDGWVIIKDPYTGPTTAVFTLAPPEPAPTPVGTILDGLIDSKPGEDDGRIGEWGDSAFDLADSAGLCVTASRWLPGDPEEWFDLGLVDANGIVTARRD